MSLPHTWNNKDGQDGGDDYYRGSGVYQRSLSLDDRFEHRKLYLHFDGAAIVAHVSINGKRLGTHKGSYGAFRFDVTEFLKLNQPNTIEVRVNNEFNPDVAPLSADFTFFGGLYRQARLIATDGLHFDAMNYASNGVFWDQQSISHHYAHLRLRTTVQNERANNKKVRLLAEVHDREGVLVASNSKDLTINAGQTMPVDLPLEFDKPHLWHGKTDPYLYQTSVKLIDGATLIDSVSDSIGLRFFHVDKDQGFYLNAKPYPLYGINRMPDASNKGTAVSEADHEKDLALMLELGATSVRLGHQQRDPFVYRRTDETGLLVWAEIPLINHITDSEQFANNIKQQARELVRQNYNRASIVMWGLYNEITLKPGPNPRPLVNELNALVKQEDPHRLTTAAVAAEGELDDSLVITPDLVAYNRYDGWYYGDFKNFSNFLDTKRQHAPNLRVGIGEYGAGAGTTIQSSSPVIQDHSEQYQSLFHEAYWEDLSNRPYVWGKYIWVLADFAVDNRDEGDTTGRNDKGLVSYDRKIKKDAFYWYKANWSEEPVLYITDRRHAIRNQAQVDIKVFSNQKEVELFVNEKSQGRLARGEFPRFIWPDVSLAMGDNKIQAVSVNSDSSLTEEINIRRINSSNTQISSTVLGVDSEQGAIYNPPVGATLKDLQKLLSLPTGSRLEGASTSESSLSIGDSVRITAQDGTTSQVYALSDAAVSVAKPVSASNEIANALSIGPFDIPVMSAKKANDGLIIKNASDVDDVNLWNTMGGNNHWWKVDLGTNYYLQSIESVWPQHSSMLEPGVMSYSVEVAKEFQQTFEQFSETYTEVVDARENTRVGTTVDSLGVQARFVRVRLHKSTIFADAPMVGDYPIYGAEEFTIVGGLVSSNAVPIDYKQHRIATPVGMSMAELLTRLLAVSGVQLTFKNSNNETELDLSTEAKGKFLIAKNNSNGISERYTLLELSGP